MWTRSASQVRATERRRAEGPKFSLEMPDVAKAAHLSLPPRNGQSSGPSGPLLHSYMAVGRILYGVIPLITTIFPRLLFVGSAAKHTTCCFLLEISTKPTSTISAHLVIKSHKLLEEMTSASRYSSLSRRMALIPVLHCALEPRTGRSYICVHLTFYFFLPAVS
jgi:hypothetical protein